MFATKLQIRLPRRITAYFLLFGIAALLWLSVAVVYVAHSVTETRSESASLRSLGLASDRVTLSYLRNKSGDFQPLLSEIRAQSRADYCAVVSDSGEYLAHSSDSYKGRMAVEQGNITDRWGEVVELQFVSDDGKAVREYRAPLKPGGKSLGTLRLGFAQTSIWGYLAAGAQFAPLALLGPACCMLAGAVLVNRMVRPVADIEQQL
jgi:sensor histidine kinase regulating citrate/malate metabolism